MREKIRASRVRASKFVLSRPRKFKNLLASAAKLPQEVARSRQRIGTTKIYEGVLPSSDSNVRGRERCARVCGRRYDETRREGRGGEGEVVRRSSSIGRKIFEIPGEPRDDSISQRPLNGPL